MRFPVVKTWRPGVEFDTDNQGNTSAAADGIGAAIFTVVDIHRPGKFPARVFFTRQWRDPDGKTFGKGKLHIMTAQAFKRRLRGYMHEYELSGNQT